MGHLRIFYSATPALRALVSSLSCLLVACGPTVQSKLAPGAGIPNHIAVLPPDYSVDIPKERVDIVRAALMSELRNRNYIVADDAVVNRACSSAACNERSRLSSQYLVDAFLSLSIDSFSKNSFLAGYYNQLSGKLVVVNPSGQELLSIEHAQSEKGGLLFNSGQVFQGIISQVQNTGDGAYRDLASKFAQTLVEQLPLAETAETKASVEPVDLVLTSVTAQWNSQTSYTVCAQGTPRSFGALLIGNNRISMREVTPGRYCTSLPALVALPESQSAYAELRTAYGNSLRERVVLPSAPACNLDGRLRVANNAATLTCIAVGQDGSKREQGCSERVASCKVEKILLFGSSTEGGLYKKIGESRAASLQIPQGEGDYEAVTVSAGGNASMPVRVSSSKD